MRIDPMAIPDVCLIQADKFGDERGFFSETYSLRTMADSGIDVAFVQDNQSFSAAPYTVRGLHFQRPPCAQDKLIRVLRGAIFDVAVDIRRGSPSYGHQVGTELSAANWQQLFVPKGFAHGFVTLAPNTEVEYKVSDFYAPECEAGLFWNDPALGIEWPVSDDQVTLNDRDRGFPRFRDFESPFL